MSNKVIRSGKVGSKSGRFGAVLSAVGVSALILSACGSSSSSTTTGSQTTSSKKGITVGVTILSTQEPWYATVEKGMQKEASALGVKLIVTNSNSSVVTEASDIRDLISAKVNVLAITPVNSQSSIPAVQAASSAGIPVITWNNTLNNSIPKAFVGINNLAYGEAAGKQAIPYIEKNMGGKANIGTLVLPGYPTVNARTTGFLKEVRTLPGVHLVAEGTFNGTPSSAYTGLRNILTAHPNINLIFAPAEGATDAVNSALSATGSHAVVVGLDLDAVGEKEVLAKNSPLKILVTQNPYRIGVETIATAVKVARHEKVPSNVLVPFNVINASNIKAYVAKWPIPN